MTLNSGLKSFHSMRKKIDNVYFSLRDKSFFIEKHILPFVFVHINKTGGTSVARALGIRRRHRTARELEIEYGALWTQKFRFSIVRNPWDRVVSHYHYRLMTNESGLAEEQIAFIDWVKLAYGEKDPKYCDRPKQFGAQWDWLIDQSGNCAVDYVMRFENLEDDFITLCSKLNRKAFLPHLNRSNRGDYRSYFDNETKEIIAMRFKVDLEKFGYEY
jgi:chondroitin 4-sulfotransferase 11